MKQNVSRCATLYTTDLQLFELANMEPLMWANIQLFMLVDI